MRSVKEKKNLASMMTQEVHTYGIEVREGWSHYYMVLLKVDFGKENGIVEPYVSRIITLLPSRDVFRKHHPDVILWKKGKSDWDEKIRLFQEKSQNEIRDFVLAECIKTMYFVWS